MGIGIWLAGAQKAEIGKSDPILTRLAAQDKRLWISKPNLRRLYFLLFPACMGIELTSGFDSQMINALQIVPRWQSYFNNPEGALKGIIAAAYSLGAILSLPLVPIINDKLGRRWSIFIGSWVMIIGSVIQGLSVHVGMYIIARMILGFGIPTCIVAGSSLIGELAFANERPMLTSLFNVSFFVGQIIAAAICFVTNDIDSDWAWRIPSLLQLCPSLVQIFFIFTVPESPRWLISKDQSDKARQILAEFHAEGDARSEFVRAEMTQIRTTIHLELEASEKSWKDLIRTSGMRRRLLITSMLGLFTQWSGNTLISYYLGDLLELIGLKDSKSIQTINVSIACWSLFCGVTVSYLVLKIRRRVMYLACTISMLLCYIAWTISLERAQTAVEAHHPNKAANVAVIFFIYAYSPCYNMGYNALTYTYMIEVWPYMERSRGLVFFQLFGRLANFFTTFVNPIGVGDVGWKYLISYCCWLAFEVGFVYLFFPETFGRTLEELTFIFENKHLTDQAVAAVKKVVGRDSASRDGRRSEYNEIT